VVQEIHLQQVLLKEILEEIQVTLKLYEVVAEVHLLVMDLISGGGGAGAGSQHIELATG
jgi:hypothetical protein